MYRYTEESRNNLLKIISDTKNVWLPYQIVKEYGKNRVKIIFEKMNEIQEIQKYYDQLKDKIKISWRLNEKNTFKKLDKNFNDIIDKFKEEQIRHDNDYILNKLFDIYNGKTGDNFNKEKLDEIKLEAKDRYEKKIPPGYMDKNKNENDKYGDLIIWYQMIDYAKKNKRNIVFITDDKKEDWFKLENKMNICPRYELLEEFYNKTGQTIIIKDVKSFINGAKNLIEEDKNKIIEESEKSNEQIKSNPYLDYMHAKWLNSVKTLIDNLQFNLNFNDKMNEISENYNQISNHLSSNMSKITQLNENSILTNNIKKDDALREEDIQFDDKKLKK